MEQPALTVDDLYNEMADLARDQGVATQETWNDLVDEVVDGHSDLGEIDAEEDTEAMKRDLRAMWGEYKIESGVEMVETADFTELDPLEKVDKEASDAEF